MALTLSPTCDAAIAFRKTHPRAFVGLLRGLRAATDALPDVSTCCNVAEELPGCLGELFAQKNLPDMRPWLRKVEAAIEPSLLNASAAASVSSKPLDIASVLVGGATPLVVQRCDDEIAAVEASLEAYLVESVTPLFKHVRSYKSVAVEEYLVEVPQPRLKEVPRDWVRVNATKKDVRFRPPVVARRLASLNEARERRQAAGEAGWAAFLAEVGGEAYFPWQRLAAALATLDCLLALAEIARLPGYCCPTILPDEPCGGGERRGEGRDGAQLLAVGARHPMVEALLPPGGIFVPNDISISSSILDSSRAAPAAPAAPAAASKGGVRAETEWEAALGAWEQAEKESGVAATTAASSVDHEPEKQQGRQKQQEHCLIITGPNMGGKSSYLRQSA